MTKLDVLAPWPLDSHDTMLAAIGALCLVTFSVLTGKVLLPSLRYFWAMAREAMQTRWQGFVAAHYGRRGGLIWYRLGRFKINHSSAHWQITVCRKRREAIDKVQSREA